MNREDSAAQGHAVGLIPSSPMLLDASVWPIEELSEAYRQYASKTKNEVQ